MLFLTNYGTLLLMRVDIFNHIPFLILINIKDNKKSKYNY